MVRMLVIFNMADAHEIALVEIIGEKVIPQISDLEEK